MVPLETPFKIIAVFVRVFLILEFVKLEPERDSERQTLSETERQRETLS